MYEGNTKGRFNDKIYKPLSLAIAAELRESLLG
jgi:hypothetical protein